ncbi:MAG TPA: MmgE/PrpD family protein [Actinophytocola sp.]|jgi:2-methylcitrate dehydratase PrpD|nr:MmgE/PrpD family protein [Actinophytocola sp.]
MTVIDEPVDEPVREAPRGYPLTERLARYCVERSTDLPAAVSEQAKWVLLDELGCVVAGRGLPPGRLIAEYVAALGGSEQSTVVGVGDLRVPEANAALANATSSHADEIDGSHVTEGHPGASIVATALAVAQARQRTGKELLSAIVLGYDIGTRLVEAAGGRRHLITTRHVHSDFLHTFACAAAAGTLLGLSVDEMRHAFALAAAWSPATPAVFFAEREHLSKALNCGIVAQAGTSAAVLAASGFQGHDSAFEAPDGVLDVWTGGHVGPEWFADLGTRAAIEDVNFKFFSAGYPIHAPLRAGLDLLAEHGIEPVDIVRIEAHLTTNSAEIVDDRAMPSICLQDMLAVGLVHGRLGVAEAHDAALLDLPEVRRLRELISVVAAPDLDAANPRGRGGRLHIWTSDGTEHARLQEYPPGHCRAGDTSWDALVEKFLDNAGATLGRGPAEEVVAAVARLDAGGDVADLVAALGAAGPR